MGCGDEERTDLRESIDEKSSCEEGRVEGTQQLPTHERAHPWPRRSNPRGAHLPPVRGSSVEQGLIVAIIEDTSRSIDSTRALPDTGRLH
jgi:hypothetical protein